MSGRVAIVTGGSAGIGASICNHLLDAGWTVVSMSRRAGERAHPRLHAIEVDLGDVEATRGAALDACARFPVTAIVHNAGAMRPALLPDVAVEDLEALAALHLTAPLLLVQAALPEMRRQRFGRIVLVSSRAALGLATRTAYSATKSGMFGMARTWALELGRDGITANVVAPGPVVTDMFHEVIPREQAAIDATAVKIPVGRVGVPDDVARAVMFFVAPENGFVTGQSLYVCGGTSVGSITY
ncbi:MAG: SDR family oxidoreductase [Burkholderiaceae bacterium]|jgi:NAD(P)-dependent dehydrogenase (short-subunit alcohol dehydrogenase family)|nr:SDR family oxidoreductase [Burkholderiales bacterium]MCZ8103368.1 SDR family oxidoreductase [Burkholderiales bacterium]MCZ8341338.1 SDR family oxidoreductase [Burkholderiaceae bacterium]